MGVRISATSFPTGKLFCPLHIKRKRISLHEGHPKGYWKGVVHILLSYNTPQQEYSGNLGPWATPDLKSQQPCSWVYRSGKLLKMTWHRDSADQGAAGAEPDTDQSRAHAHLRHESLITWDNLVGTASRGKGSCAQCTFPLSLKVTATEQPTSDHSCIPLAGAHFLIKSCAWLSGPSPLSTIMSSKNPDQIVSPHGGYALGSVAWGP